MAYIASHHDYFVQHSLFGYSALAGHLVYHHPQPPAVGGQQQPTGFTSLFKQMSLWRPPQDPHYYMDSGASSHLSFNKGNIFSLTPCNSKSIMVGNVDVLPVNFIGNTFLLFPQNRFYLKNVLVSNKLVKNIIFIRQLTKDNLVSVEFHPSSFSTKNILKQVYFFKEVIVLEISIPSFLNLVRLLLLSLLCLPKHGIIIYVIWAFQFIFFYFLDTLLIILIKVCPIVMLVKVEITFCFLFLNLKLKLLDCLYILIFGHHLLLILVVSSIMFFFLIISGIFFMDISITC